MQNSKLVLLLKTFDKKEQKELDKFIRSPYCNTNSTFIQFWDYLKNIIPNYDTVELDDKSVYQHLYPKLKTFDERKLRNLKNRFLKLVERFLVFEALKKDDLTYQKKLKVAYYEREMYERFEANGKDIEKNIQKQLIKNEVDFYELLEINHDFYFNQQSDKQIADLPYLRQCSQHLESYYWLKKLKYACIWYSRKKRFQETIPSEINSFALPKDYLDSGSPLFILYHNILSIFIQYDIKGKDILLYQNTIKLYKYHLPNIPADDQIILLTHLLNYGIAGSRIQSQPFIQEIFNLYDMGIRQKIFFWKGQIQTITILNAIYLGCQLEQFEWAEKILTENKGNVTITDEESFTNYSLATIKFYKNEFTEAITLLENVNFKKDLILEISRRSLQVRSSFEAYRLDRTFVKLVNNKAHNFKLFLKRKHKISETKQSSIFNLVDTILKAIAILENDTLNKEALKRLVNDVKNEKNFAGREWMLSHLTTF